MVPTEFSLTPPPPLQSSVGGGPNLQSSEFELVLSREGMGNSKWNPPANGTIKVVFCVKTSKWLTNMMCLHMTINALNQVVTVTTG